MPRIPYADLETLPADSRAFLKRLAPLNIFRMMANAPHLIEPFVGLGSAFLFKGVLDPIEREVAILRVGYISGASYETAQHEKIGRDIGMDDGLIAAVRYGPASDTLSDRQRMIIHFVDDIVANVRASENTFGPVLETFGPDGAQGLTLVIGYYMMVCRFLETFDVDVEDGGAKGIRTEREDD